MALCALGCGFRVPPHGPFGISGARWWWFTVLAAFKEAPSRCGDLKEGGPTEHGAFAEFDFDSFFRLLAS